MLEQGLWKSIWRAGAGRGGCGPRLRRPVRGRRAAGALRRRGRSRRRQARLQAHRAAAPGLARAGPRRGPRTSRRTSAPSAPESPPRSRPPGGLARGAHGRVGAARRGGRRAGCRRARRGHRCSRPTASTASRARTPTTSRSRASSPWSWSARATERARPRAWRSSPPAPPTGRASFRTCRRTCVTPPTSPTAPARSPRPTTRVSVEVMDRAEIEKLGMGGLVGVAQGSDEEPRLIVLRYDGRADAARWRSSARP